MESTSFLNLDLQRPDISAVSCAVADDSNSRLIRARLSDGGLAWTPPSGTRGQIRFKKPDGHGGAYDTLPNGSEAVTFDGSTAVLALADQVLALDGPGTVRMQLHLYNTAGERLSSFAFDLFVGENVLTDATIESTDYYNLLTAQISAVLNAAESLTGMTASASALTSGTPPTVIVTGGSGGVPYNLNFGIPAGPVGPQGPQGPQGRDGQGTVNSVMGVPADADLDVPARKLFNLIYPVGSIYMSTNAASPATLFGGTWARIEGKFLLASSSDGRDERYAPGAKGGVDAIALSAENIPAHSHSISFDKTTVGWYTAGTMYGGYLNSKYNNDGSTSYTTGNTGSGTAFDILPPYLAVYVWQRTALAT